MATSPVDAPRARVLAALSPLGSVVVREREHISLVREHADGSRTPLTVPDHARTKGSTLRTICARAGIDRDESLTAYEQQ